MRSHRAAAGRLARLVAVTALGLLAAALLSAGPAAAATGTYVRLAQLTPEMAGSDLVLSSVSDPSRSVTIPGVGYGVLTGYRLIEPGDYVVGMAAAGATGTQSVSLTLNAMAGNSYTLAAVGKPANQPGLSVFTDDLTPPEPGQARLRVIGASPTSPVLDVRGPGGDIALGLPYAAASGYRNVPAGPSTLVVAAPGGTPVNVPVTVAANQVASVVLVDRDGTIAASVTVDAEGPSQVPPGPIDAGFGGTAPGAPGGPTAVLTLGALAVAAAALATVLARRSEDARQRR